MPGWRHCWRPCWGFGGGCPRTHDDAEYERPQGERTAAQAERDGTPEARTLKDGEVYAMIDSLGDVGKALADGKPESLNELYDSLQLRLKYEPHARVVEAAISPRVVSVRVRGRR